MKRLVILGCAAGLALAVASPAAARDPGRWTLTGVSSVPITYWQGVASDPRRNLFFDGVYTGLARTTPRLFQTASLGNAIPLGVGATQGYNHIGDISWDEREGGRILLPLECYDPVRAQNTCGRGAIGVADPRTLAWRYHVNLRPDQIPKAMWAEVSPDGRRIWTSSGPDLLAYRASDVRPSNAYPAPPIGAVRRLRRATPPSGITGAAFRRGRLLLAGQGTGEFRVYSVDLDSGRRRLEIERRIRGESEGLDVVRVMGGRLHWLVAPFVPGSGSPTYGPESALLHFTPRRWRRGLRVRVRARSGVAGRVVRLRVRVTRRGRPVRRARLSFAGVRATTNRRGRARFRVRFSRPGRYRMLARRGRRRGLSRFVFIRDAGGASAAAFGAPRRVPANGAG